ncbi:MAG: phosphonopyruvate decarboxylase [Bacteroidales bacterium]|jgi:phosphonopyruvate decarboxylase|nr:phosphonopyruvate decarboxylase [Bacteroidales bacterium]
MINPQNIYDLLVKNSIELFTGVPDSLLKDFCAYITDNAPSNRHIIAANEGSAVAIAAGHYLATKNPALVYMQNSGIGNATNPLLSLADEKVYKIPMLLMVGWRGEPNVKDEPQHIKQGEVTLDLLAAMKIPYEIIDTDETVAVKQIQQLTIGTKTKGFPHAAVIRKNTFSPYTLKSKRENAFEMSREDAMQVVVNSLQKEDIIVSTTGKLSRELFEYREHTGAGHKNDFLTVGSMGHSISIALGIAPNTEKNIYCLDGDGAILMHTGAMATAGVSGLKKLRHIVFNNGAHESVGAQPTVALQVNLPQIATAFGYKNVWSVSTLEELLKVLNVFGSGSTDGPSFLEIKINTLSRENLGRPTRTTHENKDDFMQNFK